MLTAAETQAVTYAVGQRPMEYEGRTRKANQALHLWLANVAYWRAYPGKPPQVEATDKDGVAAWYRIHAAVLEALRPLMPAPLDASKPRWPLVSPPAKWSTGARFQAKRPANPKEPQTRYHAGIDLAAALGDPVLAMEDGVILATNVGWEAPTKATIVQTDSGETLVYAGVSGDGSPPVGTKVAAGDIVGHVTAYPKGSTMLHFQAYRFPETPTKGAVQAQFQWKVGKSEPKNLVDPTDYLTTAALNTPVLPEDEAFAGFGQTADPGGEDEDDEGQNEVQDEQKASPGSAGVVIAAVAVVALIAAVFLGRR